MIGIPAISSGDGSARSRYPGTRPFSDSPEDCERFFGRSEDGEQLFLRVLSVSLLLQFGTSGLGKTSLLQASLFPRLRKKQFLPVMVRLNVAEEALVLAVARSVEQACKSEGLELPEVRKDGLWELLSTALVWRHDLLLTPVLVFDQFEEVFTLRDAAFRRNLAEEFGALATGVAPERLRNSQTALPERFGARPLVKIVISLREDYLGALQEFSAAIPGLFHERLRLEPLAERAAREAITKPAQLVAKEGEEPFWTPPFGFEPAALDSMITYLTGESGVIEPFELQLLCRHAEAIAHAKSGKGEDPVVLTLSDFSGSTDFRSVLENFYISALNKLPSSVRGNTEELCEHGLLDRDGHRLLLEEGQIRVDFSLESETLDVLVRERLIRRERRLESVFYEISHDRLADSIFASRRNRLPKKEQQRIRRLKITNFLVSALCVVLILLGGAAAKFYWRAETEKKSAETLLGFTLGEKFLGEIRESGRTTTLKQVRDRVESLLEDAGQTDPLIRGLALRNAGDIKRADGQLKQSLELFRDALDKSLLQNPFFRESKRNRMEHEYESEREPRSILQVPHKFEKSPDGPGKAREMARTHHRIGKALGDSGEVTEALGNYRAEADAWRQVLKTDSPEATDATEDCTSLAESLVTSAALKDRMGKAKDALSDLDEAHEIVFAVLFGSQGSQSSHEVCRLQGNKIEPYPNAKALAVFSKFAMVREGILRTGESEASAELAEEARRLIPPSISVRTNAIEALTTTYRGWAARISLDAYRTALRDYEELRRWDPDNKLWQRDQAFAQLIVGEGLRRCHENKAKNCEQVSSMEEAEATILEALETLRTLADSDSINLAWKADLGQALQYYARVLGEGGRDQERLKVLDEARQIYEAIEREVGDARSVERVASLLEDKAEALADSNRHTIGKYEAAMRGGWLQEYNAEALAESNRDAIGKYKAAMQGARGRFNRLVAAHPDSTKYLRDLRVSFTRQAKVLLDLDDKAGADAAQQSSKEWDEKYTAANADSQNEADRLDASSRKYVEQAKGVDPNVALRNLRAAEADRLQYMRYQPFKWMQYHILAEIYKNIAETQEKLSPPEEPSAALSASMNAEEIAAVLTNFEKKPSALPEKTPTGILDIRLQLLDARMSLLKFHMDLNRVDDSVLAAVRAAIAEAELLVRDDPKNADYLFHLGDAKYALGRVLEKVQRASGKAGWEDAIRSGLINLEQNPIILYRPDNRRI